MITVALLDDHDVVRVSLSKYLDDHSSIKVVFQCATLSAMSHWLTLNSVDVIITDLTLRGDSGFSLLELLKTSSNPAKVIVLTMHDSEPYISRALSFGVLGYLAKTSAPEELVLAIAQVYEGKRFISGYILDNINTTDFKGKHDVIESLTGRERQVFYLLAKGMQVKHIAQELEIATKTVYVHRNNVIKKVRVNHNFELTKLALALGILDAGQLTN
jgi:DNA-binding NarL/FixJ family response regulator